MVRSALPRASTIGRVSVATELDRETRAFWQSLETSGVSTPYQSLTWYAEWMRNVAATDARPLILKAFDHQSRPALLIPLVSKTRLSARVAEFAGGKHANFGMPLFRDEAVLGSDTFGHLFEHVRAQCPEIDLLHLIGLPPSWAGVANPLVFPSSRPHTAPAALFDLGCNAEGLFDKAVSTSRRRRWRASDRALATAGVSLRHARSVLEVERVLEAFVQHKEDWFSYRRLDNPFREPGLIDFFIELAAEPAPVAEVHYLDDAKGAILATATTLIGKGRLSLMLLSYDARSPLAIHSPGIKIVRDIAANAASRGFSVFDFGLGEAQYKAALGARTEPVYATSVPFTAKGRVVSAALNAARSVKIALKNRPQLLAACLEARGILMGRASQLACW